jgi:acyl phosphate:glycerol-3-phosphate acyltransferase
MIWLACVVISYLCGSIPFGFMLGRLRGIDIREHGSRNVGATNVGRVLGRRMGLLCFVLDAAKGAAPVVASGLINLTWGRETSQLSPEEVGLWLAVAVAALIGHMISPWLGFKGGKGVATGFGAMVAMWPVMTVPALVALAVWILTILITRFVSVASIAAAASLPLSVAVIGTVHSRGTSWTQAQLLLVGICILLAALVTWKHRTNIRRLRRGEEPRIRSRRAG